MNFLNILHFWLRVYGLVSCWWLNFDAIIHAHSVKPWDTRRWSTINPACMGPSQEMTQKQNDSSTISSHHEVLIYWLPIQQFPGALKSLGRRIGATLQWWSTACILFLSFLNLPRSWVIKNGFEVPKFLFIFGYPNFLITTYRPADTNKC